MPRTALTLVFFLMLGAACSSEEPTLETVAPGEPTSPSGSSTISEETRSNAWEATATVLGERVYVPIYSHIYYRNRRSDIDLAATLSIRNTDEAAPIRVTTVRYYDSEGALVRQYVETPVRVAPMGSTYFLIEQQDDTGGVGANFIVEWEAERAVSPPVIEAVMISATSSQGISFVTQGRVLRRRQSAESGI